MTQSSVLTSTSAPPAGATPPITALAQGLMSSGPVDMAEFTVGLLRLTAQSVPGASGASITRSSRSKAGLRTTSDGDDAAGADALQQRAGQGPTLDAVALCMPVDTADLTRDDRWPAITGAVHEDETSVRSVMSLPLARAGQPGSCLTVYSHRVGFFVDDRTRELVHAAAGVAAITLAAIEQRSRADHLSEALISNRRIGAAIGILMHAQRWTEDEAFEQLRLCSQTEHRKLRDIADEVLFTGSLPIEAPPTRSTA